MIEFELVEDELRPENFREAMGRVRRILTIKINIPYSFIAAAIALYFGGLLVRLFKPFRIPLISHVTEDTGTNFIALSFFIFFLFLTAFTTTQTGINLFHGETRFLFMRIISSIILYLMAVGGLLLVWRVFSDAVILLILLIVFFWLLIQISFIFRGTKLMALNINHRKHPRTLTFLALILAGIVTGIVWYFTNDLIGIFVRNRFPDVTLPNGRINLFGESIRVTLASAAVLLIFGILSIFSLLRKKLLEFLVFWFYLLYHYGLLAMNLAQNVELADEVALSSVSNTIFQLPTRYLDLILLILTVLWVVHSLAHQTASTKLASRWSGINDFSTTHFFFAMAIVYMAGLLFFNTTEFVIPGLPHASMKLIQAGIHAVMFGLGLLLIASETLIWIISLPFRLLYWLIKHPLVIGLLILVFIIINII